MLLCVLCASGASQAQAPLPDDIAAALEALGAEQSERRVRAADLLGERGWRYRRRIAPRLIERLRTDADWRVRASSGRALGRLSVRDAVPALVASLRDPRADVRVVAAAALWRLPDPAAVPALVVLLRDADPTSRQWAALALGVVRDRRATQPLLALLDDDESSVRMDVLRSLGRIGDPRSLRTLRAFAESDERPLEERFEAVGAIARLDGPDKVNTLTSLLGMEGDARLRLRVVSALGQVGDMLAVPELRNGRRGASQVLRDAIDEAIGAIRARANVRDAQH